MSDKNDPWPPSDAKVGDHFGDYTLHPDGIWRLSVDAEHELRRQLDKWREVAGRLANLLAEGEPVIHNDKNEYYVDGDAADSAYEAYDALSKSLKGKPDKMNPVEVVLDACTECGYNAVNPNTDHCMKCGSPQRIGPPLSDGGKG